MRKTMLKSPESFAAVGILVSLSLAGIASLVPVLSFGTFYSMAATLIASDIVLYACMKIHVVKGPGERAR